MAAEGGSEIVETTGRSQCVSEFLIFSLFALFQIFHKKNKSKMRMVRWCKDVTRSQIIYERGRPAPVCVRK